MTDGQPGLLDEGGALLVALAAYTSRSEARLAYRRDHGRSLSKQHREQLADLGERLDTLRERLSAILAPPADPEELYKQFQDIQDQLRKHEGGGSDDAG